VPCAITAISHQPSAINIGHRRNLTHLSSLETSLLGDTIDIFPGF
jgi:hypothetical protein